MQKVLKDIFFIEKQAQRMMEDAKKECELISQKATETQLAMKADIENRQNARIEKMKAYETESADKKISVSSEENRKALSKIQQAYTQNKEFWIEQIFNQVTGR